MRLHCVLDRLRVEYGAPLGLDGDDVGAAACGDLVQQVPEAPEHRDQHLVTGFDQRHQDGLDTGTGGAVDQQGPAVVGLEHLPVQRHHLVHVLGKHRVELAEQRHRHGPQHPRVGVDRARAHQQAFRRVEVAVEIRHALGS